MYLRAIFTMTEYGGATEGFIDEANELLAAGKIYPDEVKKHYAKAVQHAEHALKELQTTHKLWSKWELAQQKKGKQ